jgi:hypothetical protein
MSKKWVPPIREYFYYLDYHGQLFLAETTHKNFTSCFKDKAFLNFFFTRIKENDINQSYRDKGYKWLSPCGRELNFMEAQDSPIVFHNLVSGKLYWGGDLQTDFDPDNVSLSESTGRLYHPYPVEYQKLPGLALLSSSLVLGQLSQEMHDDHFIYKGNAYALRKIK